MRKSLFWDKLRPEDLAFIERETSHKFFGFFVRARLALVPLIITVAGWIFLNDGALWRQVVMGMVITALTAISIVDAILHSRGAVGVYAIIRNVIGAGTATLILVVASGGIESPFIPVLIIIALVTTVFINPSLGRIIVLAFQLPAVWICTIIAVYELVPTFIPDVFGGGARSSPSDTLLWTTAVLYSVALTAIAALGGRIRVTVEVIFGRLLEAREKQLRIYEDQAQTMKTLSGEIAHELKNPLASIKGLGALIARKLEGKPAERMAVLRGEVERMQAILEEFLNFSRPLVPLSLERTELVELVQEVGELHEGMGRERGVELAVRGETAASIVCDPRKIKQILVNLVQNAIDASPKGGLVSMEVLRAESGVELRVIDAGPGLAEEIKGREFEAGVTNKVKGSGLGLTVAMALARQHGGDLVLESSEGGGCLARLRLPSEPPPRRSAPEENSEAGGSA